MEMQLGPEEEELVGSGIVGDEVGQRIGRLINGYLERLASANGGWDVLFRDPHDGRLWELTFPLSEMHGGGPRILRHVADSVAREKYKLKAKR